MRTIFVLSFLLVFGACSKDPEPGLAFNNGNNRNNENNKNNSNNENNTNNDDPCADGRLSESETAIDCGGPDCAPCGLGDTCLVDSDCSTGLCDFGGCYEACAVVPDGDPKFVEWPGFEMPDVVGAAGTSEAAGVALFDYDGDDDLDILTSHQRSGLKLWRNDGGTFVDATSDANLDIGDRTTTVVHADIDNDGDQDLFVGSFEGGFLLQNDGGVFTDVSAAWGIVRSAYDSLMAAAFGDFDGDGLLDLYTGSWLVDGAFPVEGPSSAMPNRLYRNLGASFELVPNPPGSANEDLGHTLGATWFDYDEDGQLDLWVANDYGTLLQPNQLFRNLGGGTFEDVAPAANFDTAVFSMTTALADYDNDNDLDAYTTTFGENVLLEMENGMATNVATARGATCGYVPDPRPPVSGGPQFIISADNQDYITEYVTQQDMFTATGWGALFFDADQDGWVDLFVPNGQIDATGWIGQDQFQPNYLHMNRGGDFTVADCGYFPDLRGTSRGAATGDLDGDGDLDLVWVDNETRGEDRTFIVQNQDGAGNWLRVKLQGTASNRDAVGSRVYLTTPSHATLALITAGHGFMSSSERVAHFGLGDETVATSVRVVWPDGTEQTVTDVPANDTLLVVQP